MAIPMRYNSRITVPLPPEEEVREVIGDTYDPHKVFNVFQMFAGTGDMYFATAGLVRAIFQAEGIGPKMREMIILRCAKVLDSPYEYKLTLFSQRTSGCLRTGFLPQAAMALWKVSMLNTCWCLRRLTSCP